MIMEHLGDITMRRTLYELIAEFGYKDGAVPYISDMYKDEARYSGQKLSDTYILNKIFKGQYANLKDFKNKMFERRVNNLQNLKEIEIQWDGRVVKVNSTKLEELMKEAVNKDLDLIKQNRKVKYVDELKKVVYKKYFSITDEFRGSIYR